jgi:hypothetical protein
VSVKLSSGAKVVGMSVSSMPTTPPRVVISLQLPVPGEAHRLPRTTSASPNTSTCACKKISVFKS